MGILRFLLALSVVVFHSSKSFLGANFVGGSLAVQAFYIISGFYMALILNEKYAKLDNAYSVFVTNRLLRLYPLYFIVVILTIVIQATDLFLFDTKSIFFDMFITYGNKLSASAIVYLFFSNVFIVGQDLALFLGLDLETGALFFTKNFHTTNPQVNAFMVLGQTWTVGIEILFYLIAPFLVKRKTILLLLFIGLSIGLRVVIYQVLQMKYDPWIYRFFPTELAYFLIGGVCYKAYKFLAKYKLNYDFPLGLCVLTCVLTIFYSNISSLLHDRHLYQTLFHLGYIGLFVTALPFIFILTKESRVDAQIGELSYPIYLVHSIAIYLDSRLGLNNVYFIVALTVTVSILLNMLVTSRIELYRQKRIMAVSVKTQ